MYASYLTSLEDAVVEVIVRNLPKAQHCLTEQFRSSELSTRERNGYGFFTNFAIPSHSLLCQEVNGTHHASALVGGELCGFILWVTYGKIDFLEGYPLGGDSWPQNESFENVSVP